MLNIRVNGHQKPLESPKTEIGEIDTRAPFQSVKAAVSLFGEVTISRQKSTPRRSRLSSENVLDEETQLILAQQEMGRIRENLETSERAKARALADLQRAQRTMTDLSTKLVVVNKSKQSALEAKEAMKQRVEQLEIEKSSGFAARDQELELAREQYLTSTAELDAAKQELTKIRQDFNAAVEAKLAALQQAEEAQCTAIVNSEKIIKLSKEISDMKDAIQQLNFVAERNQEEQAKIAEENNALQQSYTAAIEDAEKRLEGLKQEHDPELTRDLEEKLAEITADIEVLQEKMKQAHASEMNTVKEITNELNQATITLQRVADGESSLRSFVSSLRVELEDVRREHDELKEKEEERLAIEEQKQLDTFHEENLKVEQLLLDAENAKREAEEMYKNAEGLKHEAEATQIVMHEAEKQLELVLRAVEKAKAAERRALEDMKLLTDKKETLQQESASKIKISLQEFESLRGRPGESEKLVATKVVSVAAQLEEINASKNEADKKLETNLKAIEEIKAAADIALRSAEIAEEAHSAVDAELQKWRPQG